MAQPTHYSSAQVATRNSGAREQRGGGGGDGGGGHHGDRNRDDRDGGRRDFKRKSKKNSRDFENHGNKRPHRASSEKKNGFVIRNKGDK